MPSAANKSLSPETESSAHHGIKSMVKKHTILPDDINSVGDCILSPSTSDSTTATITANHTNSDNDFNNSPTGDCRTTDAKTKDTNRAKEYSDIMTNHSKIRTKKQKGHPILMSEFAMEIYVVLILFLLIRRYWVLHGITLIILAHIADILSSWFLHVKEAREIRQFKSWLLWWIRIGLDFATSTVEGEVVHRVLVANTLNFWNLIGKNYTINWFDDIGTKSRTNVLNQAKERLHQSTTHHKKFAAGLRNSFTKRKSG